MCYEMGLKRWESEEGRVICSGPECRDHVKEFQERVTEMSGKIEEELLSFTDGGPEVGCLERKIADT